MKHKGNVYDSIKNYIRSKQNIQLEYEKIEKLKKKIKKNNYIFIYKLSRKRF